jgi:hypothetical protein
MSQKAFQELTWFKYRRSYQDIGSLNPVDDEKEEIVVVRALETKGKYTQGETYEVYPEDLD